MMSKQRLHHDDLHVTASAIARNYGFLYVFHDLLPGRSGERCDTLAIAPKHLVMSGWPTAGGDQDEVIDFGDSLVLEEKVSRGDFIKDKDKPWRDEDPKYGRFFAYVACKGVIRSVDELRPEQGWFEVEPETGLWVMRKAPLRRNRLLYGHEQVLMALHASRLEMRLRELEARPSQGIFKLVGQGSPSDRGVAKPSPKPKRGDRDLGVVDQVLAVEPWIKAAHIITLVETLHNHTITQTPMNFARWLQRSGYPRRIEGGMTVYGPRKTNAS